MAQRRTTTRSAQAPEPWHLAGTPDDWAVFPSSAPGRERRAR
jgi:hypothetical protein